MRRIMRERVFQYLWLLPVIFITGCASMHDMVCNLVEPDSYVLVSIVRLPDDADILRLRYGHRFLTA